MPHLLLITMPDHLGQVAAALREGNYRVTSVHDRHLALRLARSGRIDGVVLDLPPSAAGVFTRSLAIDAQRRLPTVFVHRASGAAVDRAELVSAVDLTLARFEAGCLSGRAGEAGQFPAAGIALRSSLC